MDISVRSARRRTDFIEGVLGLTTFCSDRLDAYSLYAELQSFVDQLESVPSSISLQGNSL